MKYSIDFLLKFIPQEVRSVVSELNAAGHEAFLVGGAVRDLILGMAPHDWDIATSAAPEEVKAIFSHTVELGVQYGTVGVIVGDYDIEVTTYRTECNYSDYRHPDEVQYSKSLVEDLSRRDFTMNAIAFDVVKGFFIDPFNGIDDIENRYIQCVGVAEERMQEDPLRILRAIRFATKTSRRFTYHFHILPETSRAIHRNVALLRYVSKERINAELKKIAINAVSYGTMGNEVFTTYLLLEYKDVLFQIMPELSDCYDVAQHTPFHKYDVFTHCVKTCEHLYGAINTIWPDFTFPSCEISSEILIELFMAALLHDIGKPFCSQYDEKHIEHFPRHALVGSELTKTVLSRLRFTCAEQSAIVTLVKNHDRVLAPNRRAADNRKYANRLLSKFGPTLARQLLALKLADLYGHGIGHDEFLRLCGEGSPVEILLETSRNLNSAIKSGKTFQIKDLAITGKDLMAAGWEQGKFIGDTLKHLLECLIQEETPNTKERLMEKAVQYRAQKFQESSRVERP